MYIQRIIIDIEFLFKVQFSRKMHLIFLRAPWSSKSSPKIASKAKSVGRKGALKKNEEGETSRQDRRCEKGKGFLEVVKMHVSKT